MVVDLTLKLVTSYTIGFVSYLIHEYIWNRVNWDRLNESDSKRRSIVKTITWRVYSFIVLFFIGKVLGLDNSSSLEWTIYSNIKHLLLHIMFMKEFGILSSGVKVKFGSTGKPKDILHTKESLQDAIDRNIKLLDLKESDVLLNFIPRHTIGVYIITVPLEQVGGKVFDNKFSPEVFVEMLSEKPTKLILIPTMIKMLKESGLRPDLSGIEQVLIGLKKHQ